MSEEILAYLKIRVMVVDDHKAFREGLVSLLGEETDIQVVGEASNGLEAAALAAELKPDIVITDVSMPRMSGIDAMRQIALASPGTALVVLSAFSYDSYVVAAIDAGASAYLLKTQGVKEIAEALRSVYAGQMVFGAEVNSAVRRRMAAASPKASLAHKDLSPREIELLTLAGKGLNNREIADRVNIGERTVQTHFQNLLVKLGKSTRIEAIVVALSEGWINFDDLRSDSDTENTDEHERASTGFAD